MDDCGEGCTTDSLRHGLLLTCTDRPAAAPHGVAVGQLVRTNPAGPP
jgi:hypothetical protein